MDKNLRSALAELIGTFAFVFLSAGTVCVYHLYLHPTQPQPGLVGIALAAGFIMAVALSATVNVSGGYLNPAVTLMLWVFKRLDGAKACWLIGAQLLGTMLAGLVLRLIFHDGVLRSARFGTPHLNLPAFGGILDGHPELPMLLRGVGIEIVLTFILTYAIFGTVIDPRGPRLAGLGVGLALAADVLMGYHLTGAATNPARWLGPALWELTIRPDALRDHVVYWIGPIVGAMLAGGIYTTLILPPDEEAAAAVFAPVGGAAPARSKK